MADGRELMADAKKRPRFRGMRGGDSGGLISHQPSAISHQPFPYPDRLSALDEGCFRGPAGVGHPGPAVGDEVFEDEVNGLGAQNLASQLLGGPRLG